MAQTGSSARRTWFRVYPVMPRWPPDFRRAEIRVLNKPKNGHVLYCIGRAPNREKSACGKVICHTVNQPTNQNHFQREWAASIQVFGRDERIVLRKKTDDFNAVIPAKNLRPRMGKVPDEYRPWAQAGTAQPVIEVDGRRSLSFKGRRALDHVKFQVMPQFAARLRGPQLAPVRPRR